MIKAKQVFFLTYNLKGHGFHGEKTTIFYLTSEYYSLSVLSEKPYFLEIGPVHQKVWLFKCIMLKTLNSNFLEWEDTLTSNSGQGSRPVGNSLVNLLLSVNCVYSPKLDMKNENVSSFY